MKIIGILVKVYFADFCFNINNDLLHLLALWSVLLLLAVHAKSPEEIAEIKLQKA
jgi:hypothetical protein